MHRRESRVLQDNYHLPLIVILASFEHVLLENWDHQTDLRYAVQDLNDVFNKKYLAIAVHRIMQEIFRVFRILPSFMGRSNDIDFS